MVQKKNTALPPDADGAQPADDVAGRPADGTRLSSAAEGRPTDGTRPSNGAAEDRVPDGMQSLSGANSRSSDGKQSEDSSSGVGNRLSDDARVKGSASGDTDTAPPQVNGADDTASIDALSAADASGVYDRSKKPATAKKADSTGAGAAVPPEESAKEEDFTIPVLRTYQQDTRQVAQSKGGTELRTILAKEMEEKRTAQEEYLQKTKDIMKDSAVLRDRYRNFTKKQQSVAKGDAPAAPDVQTDKDIPEARAGERAADTQKKAGKKARSTDVAAKDGKKNITRSLSGALAYMQSAQKKESDQKHAAQTPAPSADTSPDNKSPADDTLRDGLQSADASDDPSSAANPLMRIQRAAAVSADTSDESPPAEKKGGLFSRLRGKLRPEQVFTNEERQQLQQKQDKIVEKESLQSAWKDFKQKKDKLQEMGVRARDVRSYAASAEPSTGVFFGGRNIVMALITVGILAGLVFSVFFIASSNPSEPLAPAFTEDEQFSRDVIAGDSESDIALSSLDTWPSIARADAAQGTVTKFVPYELYGAIPKQIIFEDFARTFSMRIPSDLLFAFGDYYFVGNYAAGNTTHGILIVSVKNYGDALVWMLNWEKNAINSFVSVFPTFFQRSSANNTAVEYRVIDNKDVRILTNPASQTSLMYYFFNRSFLVFVTGDPAIIPLVNARIRSANAG